VTLLKRKGRGMKDKPENPETEYLLKYLSEIGASIDGQRDILREVERELDRKQREKVAEACRIWMENRPECKPCPVCGCRR
jgi:hypothetical protein